MKRAIGQLVCALATVLLIVFAFAVVLAAQDVLPVYGTVKTWPESQARWLPRRVTTYSLAEVDVILAATSYAEAVRLNPRATDVGALWANYEAQRAKYQKTKPGGDTPPVATPAPLVGPAGPPGATGPAGPQGEPGSVDPAFLDELDSTLSEMAGISTTLAERLVAVEARLRALETSTPPVVPPPVDPPPVDPPIVFPPSSGAQFAWTEIPTSPDTITYYVAADGDDANDGLTPETPLRHPASGYFKCRTGFPDHVLLRRGDVFTLPDTTNPQDKMLNFIGPGKSGRSVSEPIVISTYGESPARPTLITGKVGGTELDSHLWVIGVRFYTPPTAMNDFVVFAVQWDSHGEDLLFEDCVFDRNPTNVIIQPGGADPNPFRNLRFRACQFLDAAGQGILATNTRGLLIEGCLFDHNGWREGEQASDRNHNVYIQHGVSQVVFRDNISSRASSHGWQLRDGGLCEWNLSLANPLAGFIGTKDTGGEPVATMRFNVALDGRDISAIQPRGYGFSVVGVAGTQHDALVYENIVAHNEHGTDGRGLTVEGDYRSVTVRDNIIFDWPTGAFVIQTHGSALSTWTNNVFESSRTLGGFLFAQPDPAKEVFSSNSYFTTAASGEWHYFGNVLQSHSGWLSAVNETDPKLGPVAFPDASRTIATYTASVGGGTTLEAFLAQARLQGKASWREAYTARKVNEYIRAGFGR